MNLGLGTRWLLSGWRLHTATVLLSVLVVSNLIALFAYHSVESEQPVLAKQVETADRMLQEIRSTRDPLTLRTAIAETDAKLTDGQTVIPPTFREADLLNAVVGAADKSGSRIASLGAADSFEESIGGRLYQAQRYHVEARGDLENVVRMVMRTEAALQPSIAMDSIIIEPEGDTWILSFDLIAYAQGR